jgi:hypothetical protein
MKTETLVRQANHASSLKSTNSRHVGFKTRRSNCEGQDIGGRETEEEEEGKKYEEK